MNNWLVIIIIILIIIWFSANRFEHFGDPIGSRLHVRLGKNFEPGYFSYKPPSAHGESGCTQVPCPPEYEDNLTCWSCCDYH